MPGRRSLREDVVTRWLVSTRPPEVVVGAGARFDVWFDAERTGQPDMRQPDAMARGLDASGAPGPKPGPAGWVPAPARPGDGDADRLPPGQHVQASMPVMHYGPVPVFNASTWNLRVSGATETGEPRCLDWAAFSALRRHEVLADFHCVTKFTILGVTWSGVAVADLLATTPPAEAATHVMVWANYGYGANLPLEAFSAADTLLATHREGRELKPDQGQPGQAGRAIPVRLEEREVGARDRVPGGGPARVLGGTRVPQQRRPVARAALLLPGTARRGAGAVVSRRTGPR